MGRFQWLTCPRKVVITKAFIWIMFCFRMTWGLQCLVRIIAGFIYWLAPLWSWTIFQARVLLYIRIVSWMGESITLNFIAFCNKLILELEISFVILIFWNEQCLFLLKFWVLIQLVNEFPQQLLKSGLISPLLYVWAVWAIGLPKGNSWDTGSKRVGIIFKKCLDSMT